MHKSNSLLGEWCRQHVCSTMLQWVGRRGAQDLIKVRVEGGSTQIAASDGWGIFGVPLYRSVSALLHSRLWAVIPLPMHSVTMQQHAAAYIRRVRLGGRHE